MGTCFGGVSLLIHETNVIHKKQKLIRFRKQCVWMTARILFRLFQSSCISLIIITNDINCILWCDIRHCFMKCGKFAAHSISIILHCYTMSTDTLVQMNKICMWPPCVCRFRCDFARLYTHTNCPTMKYADDDVCKGNFVRIQILYVCKCSSSSQYSFIHSFGKYARNRHFDIASGGAAQCNET